VFLCQNPVLLKALVDLGHIQSITIDELHGFMRLPRMAILQIQAPFESEKRDTPITLQWKVMLGGLWMSGNIDLEQTLSGIV
jgi:hypothetical protein